MNLANPGDPNPDAPFITYPESQVPRSKKQIL